MRLHKVSKHFPRISTKNILTNLSNRQVRDFYLLMEISNRMMPCVNINNISTEDTIRLIMGSRCNDLGVFWQRVTHNFLSLIEIKSSKYINKVTLDKHNKMRDTINKRANRRSCFRTRKRKEIWHCTNRRTCYHHRRAISMRNESNFPRVSTNWAVYIEVKLSRTVD